MLEVPITSRRSRLRNRYGVHRWYPSIGLFDFIFRPSYVGGVHFPPSKNEACTFSPSTEWNTRQTDTMAQALYKLLECGVEHRDVRRHNNIFVHSPDSGHVHGRPFEVVLTLHCRCL